MIQNSTPQRFSPLEKKASPQSAGGKAAAIVLREKARRAYEANPNLCGFCNSVIQIGPNDKASDARLKRFCDRSCAAKHNNRVSPKRQLSPDQKFECERCLQSFPRERSKNGNHFLPRRYCKECLPRLRAEQKGSMYIADKTRHQLYQDCHGWFSGRNCIASHARQVLILDKRPKNCQVCGYDLHVDVCHIQAVCDFTDENLISEINDPRNLIYLCKNHHWELDHGHLAL